MNLKSVLIGPDRDLANQLLEAFQELGSIQIVRDLHDYPNAHDMQRMVRNLAPQIVFLSLKDYERGTECIHAIQSAFPNLQIAVFSNSVDPQILLKLMQQGIREFLAPPFELDKLAEVMIRIRDSANKNPVASAATNLVYSFLPSKPGSGTTTLAINTALSMTKKPDSETLLMDFDLNSGLIRFLLKLDNDYTVIDAIQHAENMDEALWPQIVCEVQKLDVIHTSKITPGVRLENTHVRALLDYARKQYKAICVDLSGNMERYSIEVMQESKTIFIVCTPEIPSLHLAREKFQFLIESGLRDKVVFLLNRYSKNDLLQLDQIQNLLGAPIAFDFANDYRGVTQAVAEGSPISPASELGRQIDGFAYHLLDRPVPEGVLKPKKKEIRGFGELFKFTASRLAPASNSESKG